MGVGFLGLLRTPAQASLLATKSPLPQGECGQPAGLRGALGFFSAGGLAAVLGGAFGLAAAFAFGLLGVNASASASLRAISQCRVSWPLVRW